MKRLLTLSAYLLIGSLLMISCDEDDDDDDGGQVVVEANYYPTTVNDYRVYQNYDIDSEGNPSETEMDSSVVTDMGTFEGNDTYTIKRFEAEQNSTEYTDANEDIAYYESNSIVYANSGLLTSLSSIEIQGTLVPLPISFGDNSWFPILDFSSGSNWTVFEDNSITDSTVTIPGMPFALEFSKPLTVTGDNMGMQTIEVNGTSYETVQIDWIISTEVSVDFQGAEFKSALDITVENYYADGIGLVRNYQQPVSLSFPDFPPNGYSQSFDGSERLLLRHSVQTASE